MIILPGIGTLAGPADTVIVQRFHYTGLEMRFLDLCGFPDAMTSTTVKDGSNSTAGTYMGRPGDSSRAGIAYLFTAPGA